MEKAIRALAAIQSDEAFKALADLLSNQMLEFSVRRAALNALSRGGAPHALEHLGEFARRHSADPSAVECQKFLAARPA